MVFDGGPFDKAQDRPGGAEPRPREHREAQAYGGGVQRVGGLGESHRKAVVGVGHPCRRPDQAHAGVGIDTPIAPLVGVGQGGTGNPATDAQVVKLGLMGEQAGLDVTQALAAGQLREGHAQELVEMWKGLGGIAGRESLH